MSGWFDRRDTVVAGVLVAGLLSVTVSAGSAEAAGISNGTVLAWGDDSRCRRRTDSGEGSAAGR